MFLSTGWWLWFEMVKPEVGHKTRRGSLSKLYFDSFHALGSPTESCTGPETELSIATYSHVLTAVQQVWRGQGYWIMDFDIINHSWTLLGLMGLCKTAVSVAQSWTSLGLMGACRNKSSQERSWVVIWGIYWFAWLGLYAETACWDFAGLDWTLSILWISLLDLSGALGWEMCALGNYWAVLCSNKSCLLNR